MPADQSYEFKGVTYSLEDLKERPVVQLKELFNEVSSSLGLPGVPRFDDRINGAMRVFQRLKEYDSRLTERDLEWVRPIHTQPASSFPPFEAVTEGEVEGAGSLVTQDHPSPTSSSKRQKYFNFPVLEEIKKPRAGTLRDRVLLKLEQGGLTFDEVVELVKKFDADRIESGKNLNGSDENPERRAYEILRIVHYILGYGMRQDEQTGKITVFTK